jgi:hypothetical protein
MRKQDPFVIATLTFITLATVILLARLWSELPVSAQTLCNDEDCTVQQWLAATAGWVGFAAAAIGAWLVFGQLREQKRQTAFLIGDGDPSVDLAAVATDHFSGAIRVVNWNRRTVVLRSITISPRPPVNPLYLLTIAGDRDIDEEGIEATPNDRSKMSEDGSPAIFPSLRGWEDRNLAARSLYIVLEFDPDVDPALFGTGQNQQMIITLKFFYPGDHSSDVSLHLLAGRVNFLPRTQEMRDRMAEAL